MRGILLRQENLTYTVQVLSMVIRRPSQHAATRGFELLRRRKTVVEGKCALRSAVLVYGMCWQATAPHLHVYNRQLETEKKHELSCLPSVTK